MSKRGNNELLLDILEASQRALSYTNNKEYSDFLQDTQLQDAVIRNIEIIGEAAKKVSDDYQATYPEIPWKSISAMRNRLIHNYFGVNLDIVWEVVQSDLRPLMERVQIILKNSENYPIIFIR